MARELYFGIKALGCGVLATRPLIRQSAVFIWMLAAVGQMTAVHNFIPLHVHIYAWGGGHVKI